MTTPRHEAGAPPVDTGSQAWEAIYQADDAGWDLGTVSPPLVHGVEAKQLPTGRGLVLGCGTGHDVAWLCEQGYDMHGIDFAPSAVQAARARLAQDQGERIIEADVLAYAQQHPGTWSWLFDQTFFCALQPSQRTDYATSIAALLAPGGVIVALSMRTKFNDRQPYDSTPGHYIGLLEKAGLTLLQARQLDHESHERRRGRETLVIMGKAP